MTVTFPADRSRSALVRLSFAFGVIGLWAFICLSVATPRAFASKDHCRDISFDGVAGVGSQDIVSFIVQGCDGNPVHESCPIQVQSSEDSVDFLKRLPGSWGEPDFSSCPTPDPNDLPKKVCVNSNNGTSCNPSTGEGCHSCKLKLKLKQKRDGTYKKKNVQVCCYENADCKKKLGKIDAASIPVTIQAEKNFTEVCPPDEETCAESPSSCTVNLDPMGMVQFPGEAAKKCRKLLAKETAILSRAVIDALLLCHDLRLKGKISAAVDCNDPLAADAKGLISSAEARLQDRLFKSKDCRGAGSPWRMGYRSCPAPCDTIDILTCTKGSNLGLACTTDRDCDTAPGARDGECGDWDQVVACVACQTEAAAAQVVTDKFGTPSETMTLAAKDCQKQIGRALSSLVRTHLSETASCQKKRDDAKLVLPSSAPSCKDADLKGKRAKAEAAAADAVRSACSASLLAELDSICSGAATVADVATCVADNARSINDVVSAIAFPETGAGGGNAPSGGCPGSMTLTWAARAGQSCSIDADCIPGLCIGGVCRNPTDVDFGWSGLGHDLDTPDKGRLGLTLSCSAGQAPCGSCSITGVDPSQGNCRCSNDSSIQCSLPFASDPVCGGGTCECYATEPAPVVAGNLPLCLVHTLETGPSGNADVDAGSVSLQLDVREQIYLGIGQSAPCPTCVGDTTPRDGSADGTCSGGARDGLPCDVTAADALFGPLSLDCMPSAALETTGGGIPIRPLLTTGSASLPAASLACLSSPVSCPCGVCSGDSTIGCTSNGDCAGIGTCQPAMGAPNACSDGVCSAASGDEGFCASGPDDKFCDSPVRGDGHGIVPCLSDFDCSGVSSCTLVQPRECFVDPVAASGIASPGYPFLVGTACVAGTTSGSLNSTLGLPGPLRLELQTRSRFFCAADPLQTYEPGAGGCP